MFKLFKEVIEAGIPLELFAKNAFVPTQAVNGNSDALLSYTYTDLNNSENFTGIT